MKKRVLDIQTKLYDRLPTWLSPILLSLLTAVFLIGGMMIFRTAVAFLSKSFIALAGIEKNQLLQLATFSAPILLVFVWVKWVEKRPLSELGFYKDKWLAQLVKGWLIAFPFIIPAVFAGIFINGSSVTVNLSSATLLSLFVSIPFWLLQGGTEEVLLRGWLLPRLNQRLSLAWAIGISSLLFGLLHLATSQSSPLYIILTIVMAVMLALYFLKTDNIWSVIGLHGGLNFAFNLFGDETSQATIFRYESASFTNDMFYLIACALAFLAILWLIKDLKKEGKQASKLS